MINNDERIVVPITEWNHSTWGKIFAMHLYAIVVTNRYVSIRIKMPFHFIQNDIFVFCTCENGKFPFDYVRLLSFIWPIKNDKHIEMSGKIVQENREHSSMSKVFQIDTRPEKPEIKPWTEKCTQPHKIILIR